MAGPGLIDEQRADFLRVGSGTDVDQLAAAIIRSINDGEEPKLRAIGSNAAFCAYRACVVAAGLLARNGRDLLIRPAEEQVIGTRGDRMESVVFLLRVSR